MKSSEIRTRFLDYFKRLDHTIVSSSPLVPGNDKTLLFTNAGMVQFKETFLGQENRSYRRATSSQRCLRAGGKHNDLDNVGYTARHHTFFEMLGNFSFGDYFKLEAIQFAWNFLTKELGLAEEKLWVTVFEDDKETEDLWLNTLGVSAERFSRCGEKDNFWSMGDTGPCGPCTEIFYDHGADIPGGPPGSPLEDGDRFIEIWNLVFMQYNRHADGSMTELPQPSVDTGMGLERIAAVVQGVHSNYDIDLFQQLLTAIFALAPQADKQSASFNVIADHIRAAAFLIVDGILPGNEGRGYVLRRIIRRAARHGHKLGLTEPFFYQLVNALCIQMGDAYPELNTLSAHIEKVLLQEEEQFARTLEQGMRLLEADIDTLTGSVISGDTAFKLYDTFGFPIDLTADIAREKQLTIDMDGFEQAMAKQRSLSKGKQQFTTDYNQMTSIAAVSEFCGYENMQGTTEVLTLLIEGSEVSELHAGQKGVVVVKRTPFYAESGGQVGDRGRIYFDDVEFRVDDTTACGEAILHVGEVTSGLLRLHQTVHLAVDATRREQTAMNHSATHLLHAALTSVLGAHVQQKGSRVDCERARFDFSHYQALTDEELTAVESLINQQVRTNHLVLTEKMTPEQAKNAGATALFGEKYGELVRVLSMGEFSKELCGGTHVSRTGDIGFCKIVSEAGIATGVRRIELVSGLGAEIYVQEQQSTLRNIAGLLKSDSHSLVTKVMQLQEKMKHVEKENLSLTDKLAQNSGNTLLDKVTLVGELELLAERLDNVDPKSLRATLDQLKNKLAKGVIVLVAVNADKMSVVAGVSQGALGKAPSARLLVQEICGKGGGRDDMAQGGGGLVDDLDQRLASLGSLLK